MEPTSTAKSAQAASALAYAGTVTPDVYELAAMLDVLAPDDNSPPSRPLLESAEGSVGAILAAVQDAVQRVRSSSGSGRGADLLIKLGANGVVLAQHGHDLLHAPAVQPEAMVDVTGAGDSMVGAVACGIWKGGATAALLAAGLRAAALTLAADGPVSKGITPALFE